MARNETRVNYFYVLPRRAARTNNEHQHNECPAGGFRGVRRWKLRRGGGQGGGQGGGGCQSQTNIKLTQSVGCANAHHNEWEFIFIVPASKCETNCPERSRFSDFHAFATAYSCLKNVRQGNKPTMRRFPREVFIGVWLSSWCHRGDDFCSEGNLSCVIVAYNFLHDCWVCSKCWRLTRFKIFSSVLIIIWTSSTFPQHASLTFSSAWAQIRDFKCK